MGCGPDPFARTIQRVVLVDHLFICTIAISQVPGSVVSTSASGAGNLALKPFADARPSRVAVTPNMAAGHPKSTPSRSSEPDHGSFSGARGAIVCAGGTGVKLSQPCSCCRRKEPYEIRHEFDSGCGCEQQDCRNQSGPHRGPGGGMYSPRGLNCRAEAWI